MRWVPHNGSSVLTENLQSSRPFLREGCLVGALTSALASRPGSIMCEPTCMGLCSCNLSGWGMLPDVAVSAEGFLPVKCSR